MEEKVIIPSEAIQGKTKIDWLKVGIAIGILAVIIIGIVWIIGIAKAKPISEGDVVLFKYTLEFSDGDKISDESQFTVGSISQELGLQTKKLDEMIKNLSLGKEVSVKLSAADAFGERDESNIIIENRTFIINNRSIIEINRTFDVPSSVFESVFGDKGVLNKEYTSTSMIWRTKAVSVTNDSIKLSIENKQGEIIPLDKARFVKVIEITNEKVKVMIDANATTITTENGDYYVYVDGNNVMAKWTPKIGSKVAYGFSYVTVLNYNETSVVLDSNGPYAGKDVTITLEPLKIITKKIGPSIDVSTCYGKYGISGKAIVFIHASWCPHCQKMKPIVEKLQKEGELFASVEEQDKNFNDIVNCFGGFDGYPTFICAGSGEKKAGEMPESELRSFAERCAAGNSVAQQGIKVIGTTDGKYSITSEEICKENGKPIVYFFGADFCPHCRWEHPVFNETVQIFKDYISLHDNMGTSNDKDVFLKFNPRGTIPTIVLGCKYFRIGTTGDETESGKIAEKAALTKILCELTGSKPSSAC